MLRVSLGVGEATCAKDPTELPLFCGVAEFLESFAPSQNVVVGLGQTVVAAVAAMITCMITRWNKECRIRNSREGKGRR